MAKRRTRKQKQEAKHRLTVSWKPSALSSESEAKKSTSEANVKRQITKDFRTEEPKIVKTKGADSMEQNLILASVKKDIAKSLILSGIILASEVVLYLFWH